MCYCVLEQNFYVAFEMIFRISHLQRTRLFIKLQCCNSDKHHFILGGCINYQQKTCVMHACLVLEALLRCSVCMRVCVRVGLVAMTDCILFEAAGAAVSSYFQEWRKQRFCVRICFICLYAGKARMTGSTPSAAKLSCTPAPLLLISPLFSWTLEASIPPSALALIITKDRMHKTWRTLRHRQPRLPFSPYAEPWNNTWAPLACDSDDTHAVFLSSPISLSCSSSSSMLLCSVE